MRVLLVEDDHAIVRALTDLLEGEGFTVRSCATQDGACAALAAEDFDIALLDVTLAQGNGFAVCAAAREAAPEMPVIFLTASDDEFSTVAGLDLGAADYIAKPFRARELLSRIRAALRTRASGVQELVAGNLSLNPSSGQVRKAGRELYLSALEYRLLLFLLQNKGRIITRDQLGDALWEAAGEYVSDNALNVYIRRLREKIEDDPANPVIVTTVRGVGYKVAE
ncbi:response regulator transcription factor [Adlercreutzia sp.]|uniref:response regulator transcription factor n=1 Tax=Adlercreutzia sp. TaxID=1872387 RepID=UPI003AF1AF9B